MEMKFTPKEENVGYYFGNGAYSKENGELYNKLVPFSNEAETHHGELIRCINKLIYDLGNNGFGNVFDAEYDTYHNDVTCSDCCGSGINQFYDEEYDDDDTCQECYGSGNVEEETTEVSDITIDSYFKNLMDYLKFNSVNPKVCGLISDLVDGIKNQTLFDDDGNIIFQKVNEILNEVADYVLYEILTTENSSIKF